MSNLRFQRGIRAESLLGDFRTRSCSCRRFMLVDGKPVAWLGQLEVAESRNPINPVTPLRNAYARIPIPSRLSRLATNRIAIPYTLSPFCSFYLNCSDKAPHLLALCLIPPTLATHSGPPTKPDVHCYAAHPTLYAYNPGKCGSANQTQINYTTLPTKAPDRPCNLSRSQSTREESPPASVVLENPTGPVPVVSPATTSIPPRSCP